MQITHLFHMCNIYRCCKAYALSEKISRHIKKLLAWIEKDFFLLFEAYRNVLGNGISSSPALFCSKQTTEKVFLNPARQIWV